MYSDLYDIGGGLRSEVSERFGRWRCGVWCILQETVESD